MTRTDWTREEIADLSILPELVSGRGTARRSRVVEGQTQHRFSNDKTENGICVIQELDSRNAQRLDPGRVQPFIACNVPNRLVTSGMCFTIDFDGQSGITAEEVEHIRACRMLAAEFQAVRPLAKPMPQDHFGKGHLAPQLPRITSRVCSRLRCDVLEHCPSTMLRMVPLPETSSGRI